MAHAGMLLLTYAALVAQTSQGDSLTLRGVAPDFLALVVIAAAFWLRGSSAVIWAAAAGLLADCLGSAQLGVRMLFATVLVACVQSCVGAERRKSAIVQSLLGCTIVCVMLTGSEVAELLLNHQPIVLPKVFPPLAATAVYTSALGIVLRAVWKVMSRILPARSTEPRPHATSRWDALNR